MNKTKITEQIKQGCLYGIVSSGYSQSLQACAHALLDAGVPIIQYREKNKSESLCLEEALFLREITNKANAALFINDYPLLAKQVGADGVHLGQDDTTIAKARAIVGEDKVIGLSTHSPQQADLAQEQQVEYIGVGPVFPTKTKPDRKAAGLDFVAYAAKNSRLPFVAIGGITLANLPTVLNQGAKTVCVISNLLEADSIAKQARQIQKIIQSQRDKS